MEKGGNEPSCRINARRVEDQVIKIRVVLGNLPLTLADVALQARHESFHEIRQLDRSQNSPSKLAISSKFPSPLSWVKSIRSICLVS